MAVEPRAPLVCPRCKGPLEPRGEPVVLVCHADRLAFPVREGVAVMLLDEARPLAPGEER